MDSTTKGLLFIVLGVLSLLWFAYEAYYYIDVLMGRAFEEGNMVISVTLIVLKLIMAILFFYKGINFLRNKT